MRYKMSVSVCALFDSTVQHAQNTRSCMGPDTAYAQLEEATPEATATTIVCTGDFLPACADNCFFSKHTIVCFLASGEGKKATADLSRHSYLDQMQLENSWLDVLRPGHSHVGVGFNLHHIVRECGDYVIVGEAACNRRLASCLGQLLLRALEDDRLDCNWQRTPFPCSVARYQNILLFTPVNLSPDCQEVRKK
jgi:hypothetical protein